MSFSAIDLIRSFWVSLIAFLSAARRSFSGVDNGGRPWDLLVIALRPTGFSKDLVWVGWDRTWADWGQTIRLVIAETSGDADETLLVLFCELL